MYYPFIPQLSRNFTGGHNYAKFAQEVEISRKKSWNIFSIILILQAYV